MSGQETSYFKERMPSLSLHLIIVFLACLAAAIGVNENKRKKKSTMTLNAGYIVSFVLVALFLASRVYLGRDWDNYYRIYTSVNQQEFSFGESREIGFLLLIRLLNLFGLEFHAFIEITSVITVLLFFRAFRKMYGLLPLAIIFFFLCWGYTVVINTIRQGIAILCFLNALMYVDDSSKRAFLKYLCFIVFGALFHYSILVFLPFYWIAKIDIKPVYLFTGCIGISVFCFFFLMDIYADILLLIPKYTSYIGDEHVFADNSTFGLGAILLLVLRVTPLIFYYNISKKYPQVRKYFILYAIGISIYYSFYKFLLITRFTFYLQFCELFVFPLFVIWCWKRKGGFGKIASFGYVSLTIFNFVYLFRDFLEDQLVRNDFSIMFMNFSF